MSKKLPSNIAFTIGSQDYSDDEDLELVTSDTTPGGYDALTCELCNWRNRLPILGARVLVYNKTLHKTVWLGRVEDVDPTTSGGPARISARGYGFVGTTDRRLLGSRIENLHVVPGPLIFPGGTPLEQVIAVALANCNDVLHESIMAGAGAILLTEDSPNFALQTPQDLLNFATGLTTGYTTPLLWWVRETRNSPTLAGLVTAFMDNSARYEVALQHNDKEHIDSKYSLQGIINKSIVGWGKNGEQFEASPSPVDYSAISMERDKAVNASNAIRDVAGAQSLVGNYLGRFNIFRAISDNIVICESLVTAKAPLFGVPTSVPAYMIRSGNGLYISNMPAGMGKYNQGQKYIVRQQTTWSSGVTTLQAGEIVGLDGVVQLIESFNVNRLYNGTQLSTVSWPLVDQDTSGVYGPLYDGSHNFSSGLPTFVIDKTGALKFNAVIHPDLIADEGIEVNFAFDVSSEGFKGGPWSIPGKYKEAKIQAFLSDAPLGVVSDNFTLQLYHKNGGSAPVPMTPPIPIHTDANGEAIIAIPEFSISDRKGLFMWRVISPSTTAEICTADLHGVKLYPGLNL